MEGGEAVFDSRVIVEYVDTLSPVGKLIPPSGPRARRGAHLGSAGRRRARRRDPRAPRSAPGPGAATASAAQAWIDRQMRKVHAALEGDEPGPGRQAVLLRHPLLAGRHRGRLRARLPRLPLRPDRLAQRAPEPRQAAREAGRSGRAFIDTVPPLASLRVEPSREPRCQGRRRAKRAALAIGQYTADTTAVRHRRRPAARPAARRQQVGQQLDLVVAAAAHDVRGGDLGRGARSPAAWTSSFSAFSVFWWKLSTRSPCPDTTSACWRFGSCVATPVGQWPVWQVCAWMQPSANMKPRAALHQSAPIAIVRAMSKALTILPARADADARRAGSAPTSVLCTSSRPSLQRRADVVGELERRRAGAALGAVDDDEVRDDAGLQHRLGDRRTTPTGWPMHELEADRLAARQLAQPRDELQQLDRRRERASAAPARCSRRRSARRARRRSRR